MCKMWSIKNYGIVFICFWYTGCTFLSEGYDGYDDVYNYKFFGFNESVIGEIPAELLSQALVFDNSFKPRIMVLVTDRHRDFNLTVFSIRSIKNESNCPPTLNGTEDLRQYFITYTVLKNGNESEAVFFDNITTGCYYFMMVNAEGNHWEWGPSFYKTSLPYYNTKLTLGEIEFKPENGNSSMELIFSLKIPLNCIEVRVQLFEFNEPLDALKDIRMMKIPTSQECWFTKNGTQVKVYENKVSKLISKLELDVQSIDDQKTDKGWTAYVTWKKLKIGGGEYYLWVGPYTSKCEELYKDASITTWTPIKKDILKSLGSRHLVNTPKPPEPNGPVSITTIILIVCISLGVIVLAILAYWKWKYVTVMNRNLAARKILQKCPETVPLVDEKESNNILLMYARDSPAFMKEMDIFRQYLKQACNCHVHDLYAQNEWNMVVKHGATGWVEQLLRDGNKVVWVDTSRFRSRLNDQAWYNSDDFRDEAVPYAVNLATNLFLNATTQYRRHFVVRMAGFEVDSKLDDPLLVVAPYRRYQLPQHLSLLCEHLKDPAKHLDTDRTESEASG